MLALYFQHGTVHAEEPTVCQQDLSEKVTSEQLWCGVTVCFADANYDVVAFSRTIFCHAPSVIFFQHLMCAASTWIHRLVLCCEEINPCCFGLSCIAFVCMAPKFFSLEIFEIVLRCQLTMQQATAREACSIKANRFVIGPLFWHGWLVVRFGYVN